VSARRGDGTLDLVAIRLSLVALTAGAGCALLTNLDGLSDAPTTATQDGGDAAPPSDAASLGDSEGIPDGGGTLPTNIVFQDDFEPPALLPRAWQTALGNLSLVDGGANGSRALQAISFADAGAASRLSKTVATPTATTIACELTFNVKIYGGSYNVVLARLQMKDGTYVRLTLDGSRWQFYGQQPPLDGGAPTEFGSTFPVPSVGRPLRARLELTASGKVTVTVDGLSGSRTIRPPPTSQLTLTVGIYDIPTEAHDYAALFDDVVCFAF
jgi:hypothetical protein